MLPKIYFDDIFCDTQEDPVILDEDDTPTNEPTQVCPCLILEILNRGIVVRHKFFGACYTPEDD